MTTPPKANPLDERPSLATEQDIDRDEALRQALRTLPQDRVDVDALSARVMAQWRDREAPAGAVSAHVGGGLAALGGRGRSPTRWIGMAGLLFGVAVALIFWAQRPDPALDELLQPDVLSQIAIGEM